MDDDILDGIDLSVWDKATKDKVKKATSKALKRFSPSILVDKLGSSSKVNKTFRDEYTRSDYSETLLRTNPNAYSDKMRMANNVDEIYSSVENWKNDGKLKHPRNDNLVDFTRGKVLVQAGKSQYQVEAVIGIDKNGELQTQDIVDVSPTLFTIKNETPTAVNQNKPVNAIQGNPASNNISQSSTKNNPSGKNNSTGLEQSRDDDYLSAVDRGDMETAQRMVDEAAERAFADSKIRGEDGKLVKVYHGTYADFTVFDKAMGRSSADIQGMFFSPWDIDAGGYGPNVRAFYLNITNPADESTGYKVLNAHKGENYAGIKAREDLEKAGYDGVNNSDEEYIAFTSEQIKSADPVTYDDKGKVIPLSERFNSEKKDIRYQSRYSYDDFVSKPDMEITVVNDTSLLSAGTKTRKRVINEAIKNAKSVGVENDNGNAVVHVSDINADIIVSKRSVTHGLDRRLEISAPVIVKIGNILKNSILLNEMTPKQDTASGSYVLVGYAEGKKHNYVVRFVVNQYSNELDSVDVLYAVNTKREPAGNTPGGHISAPPTGSKISIRDLLDNVNRYYPQLLPEDVLKHYGYVARPAGDLGDSALYQSREGDLFSDDDDLSFGEYDDISDVIKRQYITYGEALKNTADFAIVIMMKRWYNISK